MWVTSAARRDRRANPRSAVEGRADAEEPTSATVETVRPGKAATSSSASSLAPALAGEAQTFANVEKPNALIRSSPVTVSGREVLPRKLGEQRSSAYIPVGGAVGRERDRTAEGLWLRAGAPRR